MRTVEGSQISRLDRPANQAAGTTPRNAARQAKKENRIKPTTQRVQNEPAGAKMDGPGPATMNITIF